MQMNKFTFSLKREFDDETSKPQKNKGRIEIEKTLKPQSERELKPFKKRTVAGVIALTR